VNAELTIPVNTPGKVLELFLCGLLHTISVTLKPIIIDQVFPVFLWEEINIAPQSMHRRMNSNNRVHQYRDSRSVLLLPLHGKTIAAGSGSPNTVERPTLSPIIEST